MRLLGNVWDDEARETSPCLPGVLLHGISNMGIMLLIIDYRLNLPGMYVMYSFWIIVANGIYITAGSLGRENQSEAERFN